MAIAYVQTAVGATENSAHTTQTATFGSTPGSGNLIVVAIGLYQGTILTVADNKTNTYTAVGTNFEAGGTGEHKGQIWYAKNITSSATFTVTVTFTGTISYSGISCSEYSGLDTTAPLDAHSEISNQTGSAVPPFECTSAAFTTVVNDELIYAMAVSPSGLSSDPFSGGTGYTIRTTGGYGGRLGTEDKIVSSTQSSVTATINPASVSFYGMAVATFKIQGAAATGNPWNAYAQQ